MKNYKIIAQSLVGENTKKEFVIAAEDEESAKKIASDRMITEESDGMLLDSPAYMLTSEEVSLQPRKIIDLIDNIELYIDEMRKTNDDETLPKSLQEYAWGYFRDVEIDKEGLKSLAVFVIDKTYRVTANITRVDNYTRAFFAKVIPFFWDTFTNRGVDIFYIVDNTFKNDGKFEVIVELLGLTGLSVVTPYSESGNLEYEAIEKQIRNYMTTMKMIVYIEKDASVNFLDKVMNLARDSKYLSVFRNKAPTNSQVELLGQP